MKPFPTLFGQSVWLLVANTLTCLMAGGSVRVAVASLSILLCLFAAGLSVKYARDLRGASAVTRPRKRARGDTLVAAEVLVPSLVCAILAMDPPSTGLMEFGWAEPLSIAVLMMAALATMILGSSLVDWLYVLPRRDGVVWEPPCMSSGEDRWRRVTKTWVRHRLVAEASFMVFFIITPAVTAIDAAVVDDVPNKWIAKFIGPAATLVGLVWSYSKTRILVGMRSVNKDPRFWLGDTVVFEPPEKWRPARRTTVRLGPMSLTSLHADPVAQPDRGGYILDVSLEDATLVTDPTSDPNGVQHEPMIAIHDGLKSITNRSHCTDADGCLGLSNACARLG